MEQLCSPYPEDRQNSLARVHLSQCGSKRLYPSYYHPALPQAQAERLCRQLQLPRAPGRSRVRSTRRTSRVRSLRGCWLQDDHGNGPGARRKYQSRERDMNTIVPTLKECERRRCAEPEQSLSHDHVSVSMRNARLISSSQACYNAAAGYPLAKMTTRLVPMPNHPLAVEVGHIALERLKRFNTLVPEAEFQIVEVGHIALERLKPAGTRGRFAPRGAWK